MGFPQEALDVRLLSLMTMYASNTGKSGGEFFTPADVSELMTRLGTDLKLRSSRIATKKAKSLKEIKERKPSNVL